ncbi:MAG: hypothetical protein Q8N58_00055 [bacterium]|nr:hypothetical protein [bacterium]
MEKGKKNTVFIFVLVLVCLLLLIIGLSVRDYLKESKWRKETMARKTQINKLWQQYLVKDPNEEDLWTIVSKSESFDLTDLATEALLQITKSEKRLLYLLEEQEYDTELRIKISDRLLENPSKEALEKIIEKVPERAETALSALLRIVDSNEIGFDCLEDVIINIASRRKWAWDKILFNPGQIKPSLCYAFMADPDYPKEALDVYFLTNLKPEHYKELIFYAHSLSDRALEEFLAVKPTNRDLREVIVGNRWGRHPEKRVKVRAAKYILANNPSEREVDLIRENCPSLRKEAWEARKKILDKRAAEQKAVPETKEDILKAIEKIRFY